MSRALRPALPHRRPGFRRPSAALPAALHPKHRRFPVRSARGWSTTAVDVRGVGQCRDQARAAETLLRSHRPDSGQGEHLRRRVPLRKPALRELGRRRIQSRGDQDAAVSRRSMVSYMTPVGSASETAIRNKASRAMRLMKSRSSLHIPAENNSRRLRGCRSSVPQSSVLPSPGFTTSGSSRVPLAAAQLGRRRPVEAQRNRGLPQGQTPRGRTRHEFELQGRVAGTQEVADAIAMPYKLSGAGSPVGSGIWSRNPAVASETATGSGPRRGRGLGQGSDPDGGSRRQHGIGRLSGVVRRATYRC